MTIYLYDTLYAWDETETHPQGFKPKACYYEECTTEDFEFLHNSDIDANISQKR